MASWETNATSSSFNANDVVKGYTTGRNRDNDAAALGVYEVTDKFGGNVFGGMGQHNELDFVTSKFRPDIVVKGYDIVGINGNGIEAIRNAITAYVEAVQTYLEKALQNAQDHVSVGFRGGEAEKAVVAYLDKVREYIYNLISGLLAFNDKINDVGNAWVQAQQNIGSNVNTSTGAFSAGSAYTGNNVQYQGASRG